MVKPPNGKYFFHYFYQWHMFHAKPSLALLKAFVASIESDIDSSIQAYQTAEFETEELDLDDERTPEIIRFYRGLDDMSWDLDELFLKHYPSMRRGSALLTMYGSLEDELNLLCYNAQKFKKYGIDLQDLNHKGIERSVTYLTKVCGLQGIKQHHSWNELSKIGKLRNIIAHASGKIEPDDKFHDYIQSRNDLSVINIYRHYEHSHINIERGYLEHVLECMNAFTSHISDTMKGMSWD